MEHDLYLIQCDHMSVLLCGARRKVRRSGRGWLRHRRPCQEIPHL